MKKHILLYSFLFITLITKSQGTSNLEETLLWIKSTIEAYPLHQPTLDYSANVTYDLSKKIIIITYTSSWNNKVIYSIPLKSINPDGYNYEKNYQFILTTIGDVIVRQDYSAQDGTTTQKNVAIAYLVFDNANFLSLNLEEKLMKAFNYTRDLSINQITSSTGFAISSNGLIITNHHVIDVATTIKVRGVNGDFSKVYNAKKIVDDKNNDLAIIKIEDQNFTTLGTIPFVINNKSSEVGTSVFALGYPLRATMGDEIKLTNGIVSSKSGFQGDITTYQVSVPVQPGNSGGPLFDNKGNLIGIINAKHLGAENVSYAIKSNYLLNLIDQMQIPPKLQAISSVATKSFTEQVKVLKKITYIIEVVQ